MMEHTERHRVALPPPADGVAFSNLSGQVSLEALAEADNASMRADGIDQTFTAEELENFNDHLTDFDPGRDNLIAVHEDQVAGEAFVVQLNQADGLRVYLHHVYLRPELRSPAVIEAMQNWAEAHAVWLHAAAGSPSPAVLRANLADGERWQRDLLADRGYHIVRYFYRMVRRPIGSVAIPPIPPGLELRPVQPDHMRQIWDAKEEAFADHWGHRQKDENDYKIFLNNPNKDPALWVVAWDGDEVAGMILNFIATEENEAYGRRRGYTEDISVRRPWRRRGLASHMLAVSLERLAEAGMTEAALAVDVDNSSGALGLYERAGYEITRRSFVYSRPLNDDR